MMWVFMRDMNNLPTPNNHDTQHHPGGPVGEVLDEDEGHQGRDNNEIGLLKEEWSLPVDADHPHHPKVPHQQGHGDVIHGHIVGLQHYSETHTVPV